MNKGFIKGLPFKIIEGEVLKTYEYDCDSCVRITLENGIFFICGGEQELYSNDQWILAKESLYSVLSNGSEVVQVEVLDGTYPLYDITVSNDEHSFFIEIGEELIKVHNLSISDYLNSVRPGSSTRPPVTTTPSTSVEEDTTIYIPETEIEFKASMLKPNTRLYAFFDGKDVTKYVLQSGFDWYEDPDTGEEFNNLPIITDGVGYVSGTFRIPNNSSIKFAAGKLEFTLTDSPTNKDATTFAKATYIYTGTNDNPDNPNLDAGGIVSNLNIDSIIQTFYCGETGGMFISKVGLYFYEKDNTQPIELRIHEVDGDNLKSEYIAGSSVVINPDIIKTSANPLDSNPTWVEFSNPVYLSEGKEYAIHMRTNSTNYILHMVDYGQQTNNITATKDISSRSLMKLSGTNTYIRDNARGIKYEIQKCKFDTKGIYTLALGNEKLGTRVLNNNSLQVSNKSNVITVTDPNHSFNVEGFVNIQLANPEGSEFGGIPYNQINGVHKIISITWDTYSFDNYYDANGNQLKITESKLDEDKLLFGNSIVTDYDIQYDNLVLNINDITLTGSSLSYTLTGYNGKSVDGSEIAYVNDSRLYSIVNKSSFNATNVKKITSRVNSERFGVKNGMALKVVAAFKTDNENISPIIDKYNMNVVAMENVINNRNSTETSNVDGDACAKAIFNTVNLYEPATGINVSFYGSVQAVANVSVYYKTLAVGEDISIDSKDWTLMNQTSNTIKSSNENDFQRYNYMVDKLDPIKSFKIKLVMNSSDSTKVPLIRKFSAVAFE